MSFQTYTLVVLILTILSITADAAFDNSRNDNLAVYWGQNSYGATHSDTANWQKTLSFYCNDDSIDVIPVAFLDVYFSTGGLPHINLANTCNDNDFPVFPGSQLANCNFLAADIKACQARGKIVTLSLGGAGGGGSFSSDAQGVQFANTVWNLFLGGSSSTRPFGAAVLDGVDLDIEGGQPTGYIAFVNQIRSLASGASKRYYITAAPQCVYPDGYLGPVLNGASFDAVYVQFYNNPCGLTHYNEPNGWNYGLWDNWARTISPNKNVKIYIGAPASSTAAGSGYVPLSTLQNIATTTRSRFPSFGGVMMWDASQAYANSRFDQGVKAFLKNGGGGPFVFPACSAPAWTSGGNYPAGSQVSYNGYIWQAKWFGSVAPAFSQSNDWTAISACSGSGGGTLTPTPTSSTTRPPTSSTTNRPSSTTSSSTPTPTGGSCAGVAAWNSTIAYTGGQQVTYNGHLWLAKWWNQAEAPGGTSGAWQDQGACTRARSLPRRNMPLLF